MRNTRNNAIAPVAKIDRVVLTSNADLHAAVSCLAQFRTVSDHARRNMGIAFGAYGRVRRLISATTGTRLEVNYRPRFRRMALIRIAVVPDDSVGLQRMELERILQTFRPAQLVIVELALDFGRNEVS